MEMGWDAMRMKMEMGWGCNEDGNECGDEMRWGCRDGDDRYCAYHLSYK